jgi:DNA mismatch repair protein MutS
MTRTNDDENSPMFVQYQRIKQEHKDEVLFFRVGDFYEMYDDDAVAVSGWLNLTLTRKDKKHRMCGVPYHAARQYIARLLKLGKKIAICEQMSNASTKGLMDREVVEIITPGTTIDEEYLDMGSSNYLACCAIPGDYASFAYIDLSTGDFFATSFPASDAPERIRQELERLQVKEMIVSESVFNTILSGFFADHPGIAVNHLADWFFELNKNRGRLIEQFGTVNLKGFALHEDSPELVPAGVLLNYLDNTAHSLLPHIRSLAIYHDSEYVNIDESSLRNLELVRNLHDGEVRFSLLEVMNETQTAPGCRLLKRRILHPVQDMGCIEKRLNMAELFYQNHNLLETIREILAKTPDLERLSSKVAMEKAHGQDMLQIKNALFRFSEIERLIREYACIFESQLALSLNVIGIRKVKALHDLLKKALVDKPSPLLNEGNLIRTGYNPELDHLHTVHNQGRQLLEAYLKEERTASGIPSLKIDYNRMIGYFIEVTNQYVPRVPSYFIRRQGMKTGERFTTDKLVALESDINGASEHIIELEKALFLELRNQAKLLLSELEAAARRIAEVDVAQSMARAATVHHWVRPVLNAGTGLRIIAGRHPVVEAHLPRGEFINNDCTLDSMDTSFILITGPNMAGKSTYLRQAALITIMAQIGSFVPAREAVIGLVDRIYCRVGASDNLARGESTFLVEMNETASILNTATQRSLVIMDEVGRGTGTNDGLAIAWAVSEELLNNIQCRTVFATHYHELSQLEHPKKANRSMEVLDNDGEVVFLRRIREGASSKSYGIHVAKLAGLNDRVCSRAEEIMRLLEEKKSRLFNKEEPVAIPAKPAPVEPSAPLQPPANPKVAQLIKELVGIEPDRFTPQEALNCIYNWKKLFGEKMPTHAVSSRNRSSDNDLFS